jgi:formylglycine-generating enzyme required for sulfatase activity
VLCYRCGGHVKDGSEKCASCGQSFAPGLKPGPAAGFGAGSRRHRVAVEGAPYKAGDVVGGRYQIKEHKAAGPLGWMYRAIEISSEVEVGLKIISPRFVQMAEEKRTFAAVLAKAQGLSHPNIARVYDSGYDQERPFIAQQHLEGLTLRRIMELRRQKGHSFTLQEVEPIVAQIAAALEAASRSFAHGNLKPDNVIVLPDLLKLTDFGLAVSLPRAPFMAAQRAGAVHRYLAPEFLLGDALEARTDVFSLGVMLGELLTGQPHDAHAVLRQRNPQLPAEVEAIFQRAIAPRPSERFASASELAAELSLLVVPGQRAPLERRDALEDAGDVVIEEAYTDPRLRIARALAAQEVPAAGQVLLPLAAPVLPEPFAAPPPYEPAPLARPARGAESPPRSAEVAAQSAETTASQLAEVAARVGASLELLTAETAVRQAPAAPGLRSGAAVDASAASMIAAGADTAGAAASAAPAEHAASSGEAAAQSEHGRPRRGAGKRAKGKHGKNRSRPPGDPAWTASEPPPASSPLPTEGALATGPTLPALERLPSAPPEPAEPAQPMPPPPPAPELAARPVSRPPLASPGFGTLIEEKKGPGPATIAVLALVATVGLGGLYTLVAGSKPVDPSAETVAAAAVAAPPDAAQKPDVQKPAPSQKPAAPRPGAGRPAEPASAKKSTEFKARNDDRSEQPARHQSLRDRISGIRENAQRALEERRRKREDAVAQAAAQRDEERPAAKRDEARAAAQREEPPAAGAKRAEPLADGAKAAALGAAVARAVADATGTRVAVRPTPPPAGAIGGLDDGDAVLASKDRSAQPAGGRLLASAAVPAVAVSAKAGEMQCPPGMERVPGGPAQVGSDARDDLRNFGDRSLATVEVKPYCIDQFEFPNTPGKLPKVAAAFAEADASCKNAGKRLCSEDEWEKACKGPAVQRFPYGASFDPNACNTQDGRDNPRQMAVVGSFGKCRSGYGVWDMSGNAAEWTATAFDAGPEKAVKGGHSARPGFDDRCASRRKLQPGQHDIKVGFRCCADAR